MAKWTAFPYGGDAFRREPAALEALWPSLHAGDVAPWPDDPRVVTAWAHFHAGDFRRAFDAGRKAGGAGITVANKAQAIYAHYLEADADARLAMLLEVAERARAQQADTPENPNAWYWQAYALGRYGQAISVVRALAEGLGGRIRTALERTIELAPRHADAHAALGTFHAEVIGAVGRFVGRLQGADAEAGARAYRRALKLNPRSAITLLEAAGGLIVLEGERRRPEAAKLRARAAACEPLDAMERLDVERARAELDG